MNCRSNLVQCLLDHALDNEAIYVKNVIMDLKPALSEAEGGIPEVQTESVSTLIFNLKGDEVERVFSRDNRGQRGLDNGRFEGARACSVN